MDFMYVVSSDYTNEHTDIYNAVSIDKVFKTKDEAATYADKCYRRFTVEAKKEEWPDRSNVKAVDVESYCDFCGCQIYPYPEYVIGETLDNGEYYHMYYMVLKVEE